MHAMPKADLLSKQHIGIANVLLVNSSKDNLKQIEAAYHLLSADKNKFSLPTIVQDTLLKKFFPLSMLPQYIWIDRDGRFMGLTSSYFINSAPIISMHNEDLRLDSVRKKRKEARK